LAYTNPADATAWTVSLVADKTDIVEGETTTLTAFASGAVNGSGLGIVILQLPTSQ
jgi:hypothetical protein